MSELYYILIGALWLLTFGFSAVSWVLMIANRLPSVNLGRLLFSPFAALDEANYTERGMRHRTRFLIGWMCCAVGVAAWLVVTRL